MSTYAPAVRTALPQPIGVPFVAASTRRPRPAEPRPDDRAAQRREIERADRQRAQAERVRDNLAARHPLSLR
ncbi:hypothetical protein ACFS27_07345 [Promicromonospora vindobonensis]|uniref:Uncharacterized protein n=1 Tax=Promicromonospora vindobonensis TaxID=195748 RepID=A0ABW5VNV6_9MICO